MEPSFLSEFFTKDTVFAIVLFLGVYMAMKYLPRLTLGVPFVDPGAVKSRLDAGDDVLVLDVRSPAEYTGGLGHVPGSLNLPLADLSARIAELGEELAPHKTEPVCVTCRTENRSPRAVKILKRAGFTDLSVMKGGMVRWNRENLPIEGKG